MKLLPHWSIGELINYIFKTETRFWFQWRAAAFGIPIYRNSGLQRIQDTQILSKGVSIILPMRLLIKSRFATDYICLQSAFPFIILNKYEPFKTILGIIFGIL